MPGPGCPIWALCKPAASPISPLRFCPSPFTSFHKRHKEASTCKLSRNSTTWRLQGLHGVEMDTEVQCRKVPRAVTLTQSSSPKKENLVVQEREGMSGPKPNPPQPQTLSSHHWPAWLPRQTTIVYCRNEEYRSSGEASARSSHKVRGRMRAQSGSASAPV